MINLTDETFTKEVLECDIPVLVDFHADWCSPCRMLAPTIEKIEKEYSEKVKVCGVNVDTTPITCISYSITSVPTLILFKNGKETDKIIGLSSYEEIEYIIKR